MKNRMSRKKKVLLVDIDDVLVYSGKIARINEFLGTNHPEDFFIDFNEQDILDDPVKNKEFFDYFFQKYYYENVNCKPDVHEILSKLNEKYNLYLCTDYIIPQHEWKSGKILADKMNFLEKNFFYLNPKNFIFTNQKTFLHADIQIDDKPSNFGPYVKTKLMFTAYRNQEMKDRDLKKQNIVRVNSWKEIGELLL